MNKGLAAPLKHLWKRVVPKSCCWETNGGRPGAAGILGHVQPAQCQLLPTAQVCGVTCAQVDGVSPPVA